MNVLDEIVAYKRLEVEAAKQAQPLAELQARLKDAPPLRDFAAALHAGLRMHLIAEVKKASPSAGLIRPDFDPVAIAQIYAANGAQCLSVLTDEKYFQGHLDYLMAVRRTVDLPLLRKDFVIDAYQVLEARVAGADCVLLIAECLNDCQLRELYFYASELGLDALIEIHEPENLERVLKLDPVLLGINNRNLKAMITDLRHTLDLRDQIPESTLLISESGIKTRSDVERLEAAGVQAILVGESLMRATDIAGEMHRILGR